MVRYFVNLIRSAGKDQGFWVMVTMSPTHQERGQSDRRMRPLTCQAQDTIYGQEDTSLLEELLPCTPGA